MTEPLLGYTIVEETDEHVIMEKRFGENGKGRIRHIFPTRSDPEEKKRAYTKVLQILYNAGAPAEERTQEAV